MEKKHAAKIICLITIIALLTAGCSAEKKTPTSGTTKSPETTTTRKETDQQATTAPDSDETYAHERYVLNGVVYETGDHLPWPEEYLPGVPELKANIVATSYDQNTKTLVMTYEDVKTEEIKEYAKTLKDKGYTASMEMEMDDSYTFGGEHEDGMSILLMHADDQSGVFTFNPDPDD